MTIFSRMGLGKLSFEIPRAVALTFDHNHPRASDFAWHGIPCPASIARSVAKRRTEYLAGRRCAIEALREQGCSTSDLPIGPDRAPLWPAGFLGSITHTDCLAAAVAIDARMVHGLGIDIEHIPAGSTLDELRKVVLVPSEDRALDGIASRLGWPAALTVAFSAKESFYKATARFAGRIFDFSALRILGSMEDGVLDMQLSEHLAERLLPGKRFSATYQVVESKVIMTACAW